MLGQWWHKACGSHQLIWLIWLKAHSWDGTHTRNCLGDQVPETRQSRHPNTAGLKQSIKWFLEIFCNIHLIVTYAFIDREASLCKRWEQTHRHRVRHHRERERELFLFFSNNFIHLHFKWYPSSYLLLCRHRIPILFSSPSLCLYEGASPPIHPLLRHPLHQIPLSRAQGIQ